MHCKHEFSHWPAVTRLERPKLEIFAAAATPERIGLTNICSRMNLVGQDFSVDA